MIRISSWIFGSLIALMALIIFGWAVELKLSRAVIPFLIVLGWLIGAFLELIFDDEPEEKLK
jgi:hypothetical protein